MITGRSTFSATGNPSTKRSVHILLCSMELLSPPGGLDCRRCCGEPPERSSASAPIIGLTNANYCCLATKDTRCRLGRGRGGPMRRKLFGLGGLKWIVVAAVVVVAWLGALQAANQPAVPPSLPLGVSRVMYELSVPADRWPTPEKVALGEKLFNDKRLSVEDRKSVVSGK